MGKLQDVAKEISNYLDTARDVWGVTYVQNESIYKYGCGLPLFEKYQIIVPICRFTDHGREFVAWFKCDNINNSCESIKDALTSNDSFYLNFDTMNYYKEEFEELTNNE